MNFRKLLTYLTVGTAAVIPFAGAQNPTILQGSYISNVFGNSNFVLNPNAQTNVANVTNATRSIATPLVATSEFNLNLTSGTFATWTLRAFDAGMKGQNCEARFSYRGFATATSTAQIVQNSLVVAQLVLTPSTDPRIASINFPCGDLANATTFRIAQTTANMTTVTPNEIGQKYSPDYPVKEYSNKTFYAPFASGSSQYDTLIICPASMGITGRIANGTSDDLIARTADVMLKERRRVIIVPRETPYSLIHINNMKTLTLAGAVICPASPSFYSNPKTIDELVMTVVDRITDLAGFDSNCFRWMEND